MKNICSKIPIQFQSIFIIALRASVARHYNIYFPIKDIEIICDNTMQNGVIVANIIYENQFRPCQLGNK